ncbi:MAG: pyridine nucleotide-disulfide oxidoreductase [Phenylobacterium zucineum]|nr:MAG: pyridine nucleotide-disulfide oxidoreductase [Phenylobacterium zucineum]
MTVAVIGGGFCGVLTAIHLLGRHPKATVRLVEKGQRIGLGRAYATGNPDHLLNVRASNMSAFPDRPRHFLEWLAHEAGEGDGFASRGAYGRYLQGLLRDAVGEGGDPGRLLLEQDEAVDLEQRGGGWRVRLAMGRGFDADAVVLATGAPAPAVGERLGGRYFSDPWALDGEALPGGTILLIGSGLTMVDVALSLERDDRRFVVISRRGLLPHEHGPAPPAPLPAGRLGSPAEALATLRAHAAVVGWRSAVDSVRGLTPALWRSWDAAARRRFLRHGRAWWDIHRHRMAPRVAARIGDLAAKERLEVVAGRIVTMTAFGDGLSVTLRRRGCLEPEGRLVAAAVDCTGLSGDLRRLALFEHLEARGLAGADPLGLGLAVDGDLRVIGRSGRATPGLYAVGPLTRAARWETVAVPDLRSQTAEVARTLVDDLLVRAPA